MDVLIFSWHVAMRRWRLLLATRNDIVTYLLTFDWFTLNVHSELAVLMCRVPVVVLARATASVNKFLINARDVFLV